MWLESEEQSQGTRPPCSSRTTNGSWSDQQQRPQKNSGQSTQRTCDVKVAGQQALNRTTAWKLTGRRERAVGLLHSVGDRSEDREGSKAKCQLVRVNRPSGQLVKHPRGVQRTHKVPMSAHSTAYSSRNYVAVSGEKRSLWRRGQLTSLIHVKPRIVGRKHISQTHKFVSVRHENFGLVGRRSPWGRRCGV